VEFDTVHSCFDTLDSRMENNTLQGAIQQYTNHIITCTILYKTEVLLISIISISYTLLSLDTAPGKVCAKLHISAFR